MICARRLCTCVYRCSGHGATGIGVKRGGRGPAVSRKG
nr:MAG TPA: hypothetical protein [Inoviridae sp.]